MAEPQIQKGLAGVTVDSTAISKVMPETNSLTYRGYAVQDLCAHASFEEVAYLLWNGELPTAAELENLRAEEAGPARDFRRPHIEVIRRFPADAHPMDTLRTAVSYLGTTETAWGGEPEEARPQPVARPVRQDPDDDRDRLPVPQRQGPDRPARRPPDGRELFQHVLRGSAAAGGDQGLRHLDDPLCRTQLQRVDLSPCGRPSPPAGRTSIPR